MRVGKQFLRLFLVAIIAAGAVVFLGRSSTDAPSVELEADVTNEGPQQDSIQTAESRELIETRVFTSAEFKQAYDNLSLPNITPIVIAPEITGDLDADSRIRTLAENRGYQLRDVASGILNEVDDKPVQELLKNNWIDMQQMAKEEGINLEFRSGYRSIEDQRDIFLSRLYGAGASNAGVAGGAQDSIIDSVLATTAPPGYSRHHGGYTIDVEDPGSAIFANSAAYAWIAENNFEKAKIHGFIPSYPNGLTNQGPNPEPWEFVWVGKNVTFQ